MRQKLGLKNHETGKSISGDKRHWSARGDAIGRAAEHHGKRPTSPSFGVADDEEIGYPFEQFMHGWGAVEVCSAAIPIAGAAL